MFLYGSVDFHGVNEGGNVVILVFGLVHAFLVEIPDVRAEDFA